MNFNRRNQRPEEIEENLEYITLIWLDENINDSEESRKTQRLLCELNDCVQFYTVPSLCFDYIKRILNSVRHGSGQTSGRIGSSRAGSGRVMKMILDLGSDRVGSRQARVGSGRVKACSGRAGSGQ